MKQCNDPFKWECPYLADGKSVIELFMRLCKAKNKQLALKLKQWVLHEPSSGQYVIVEICEEDEIFFPFGTATRNAREMYISMIMSVLILEEINNGS